MKKSRNRVEKILDFEKEAERFLREYGFEWCISAPQPVPIEEIAEKMSLTVEYGYTLSLDNAIQGAVTFSDGVMQVYDSEKNPIEYTYHEGTVFICAALSSSSGRIRNTLAHECFHWYKHRKFFVRQLSGGCGKRGLSHKCVSDNISQKVRRYTATDWAEWQARQITPKILMPRDAVQTLLDKHKNTLPQSNKDWSSFLAEVGRTFQVSKQSACLRLVDFNVPGAQNYYSTHYSSGISTDGTRKVSRRDMLELYFSDNNLRQKLVSGEYCYTSDGYIVVNHPQYVKKDGSVCTLTEYGICHLAECTVILQGEISSNQDSDYILGLPFRKESDSIDPSSRVCDAYIDWPRPKLSAVHFASSEEKLSERAEKMRVKIEELTQKTRSASADIGERIVALNWSVDHFVNATCLGKNRYYDFRHNYDPSLCKASSPNKDSFKLQTYLAAGHALGIRLPQMKQILEKTDYSLKDNLPQHIAYEFCFTVCDDCTVEQCNAILKLAGFRTLSE